MGAIERFMELGRKPKHVEIFKYLFEKREAKKEEIIQQGIYSRTTINRELKYLIDNGWIEKVKKRKWGRTKKGRKNYFVYRLYRG